MGGTLRRSISVHPSLHDAITLHCQARGETVTRFAEEVLGEAVGWTRPPRESRPRLRTEPPTVRRAAPPPPREEPPPASRGGIRKPPPGRLGRAAPRLREEADRRLAQELRAGAAPAAGVKAAPRPAPSRVEVRPRAGLPVLW